MMDAPLMNAEMMVTMHRTEYEARRCSPTNTDEGDECDEIEGDECDEEEAVQYPLSELFLALCALLSLVEPFRDFLCLVPPPPLPPPPCPPPPPPPPPPLPPPPPPPGTPAR